MHVRSGDTVVSVEGHVIHISDGTSSASFLRDTGTPDINHPATKGWLLHMLREAAIRVAVHCDQRGVRIVVSWQSDNGGLYHDEFSGDDAEAAALLAAWGQAA